MALPAVTTLALRRCVPAAALLVGCVAPLMTSSPAWSATAATAATSQETGTTARARATYEEAVRAVDLLGARSDRLAASAEQAATVAARLRDEVQNQDGGTIGSAISGFFADGPSTTDRAVEAAENAAHLADLAAEAERALDEAILEAERARLAYDEVLADQAHRQAGWSAMDAAQFAVSLAQPEKGYRVDDREQDLRNRSALRRWERYLLGLGRAAVVPPAAKRLADPDRLPDGLDLLRAPTGEAVTGVAEAEDGSGRSLVVLPAETIQAVSTAFSRLGLSEVPGAGSPSTYACGGLLADAWGAVDQLPADSVSQWRELESVPLSALQVGDAVVLGDRRDGLEQSGVYVGDQQVIVADPDSGTAAVRPLPRRDLHGVKRVTLPASRTYAAPHAGPCGVTAAPTTTTAPAPEAPAGPTGGVPFQLPVAVEDYRISAGFGQSGVMWSSTHTGQDFAAATGTAVVAVAAGVVTVENPSWAGNLVRVDHGGGVETWYAHLAEVDVASGEQVGKGQRIGTVGSTGNSTGPHLHFEVRLDGLPVDPSLVLEIPEVPRAVHSNGAMPVEALCDAAPGGAQLLACDAAVSFRLMAEAFAAEIGTDLCVTDSYRSLAAQVDLAASKPGMAATPGTSVHGLGRALDLCGGVERFGTAEHLWVVTNGPAFGWGHPSWAAEGGSRPEPWHFEFGA